MQEQMRMAFMQEGGMKDDGMDKDPVSGNEVPPGSMAKEVRDDIPAMLSEGEYVVPADVVQYFGVKFFEDLRMQAKMGLKNMEKDGRIGGEPIDDEELKPDETAVLLEVMKMDEGGLPSLKGDDLRNYATTPTVKQYLTPGAMQVAVANQTPPPIDTGEPVCPPGMVFDEEKNMCVPIEQAKTENQEVRDPRDPTVKPDAKPWYEGITADANESLKRYFGTGSKIGAGIAGAVLSATPLGILGGIAGGFGAQTMNLSMARAEVQLRLAIGDKEGARILKAGIENQLKNTIGLGKADSFYESTFGSGGERRVISALEAAGITVPDSIKDKDFRESLEFDEDFTSYLKGLSRVDQAKIKKLIGIDTKSYATSSTGAAEIPDISATPTTQSDKDSLSKAINLTSGSGKNQLKAIETSREKSDKDSRSTAQKIQDRRKRENEAKKAAVAATKKAKEEREAKTGGKKFTSGTGGIQPDGPTTSDSGTGASGYGGYGAAPGGRNKGGLMKKR